MSDEKLRELERRWKETGAPEDEEAYLVEQVRVGETLDWDGYSRLSELNVEAAAEYLRGRVERGELTQERLELAAYCGEAGAILLSPTDTASTLELWLFGLKRWGPQAEVLAAIACARRALPSWERSSRSRAPHGAILAARNWALCPCRPHLSAVDEAGLLCGQEAYELHATEPSLRTCAAAGAIAASTAHLAVGIAGLSERAGIEDPDMRAVGTLSGIVRQTLEFLDPTDSKEEAKSPVVSLMSIELIQWALVSPTTHQESV